MCSEDRKALSNNTDNSALKLQGRPNPDIKTLKHIMI